MKSRRKVTSKGDSRRSAWPWPRTGHATHFWVLWRDVREIENHTQDNRLAPSVDNIFSYTLLINTDKDIPFCFLSSISPLWSPNIYHSIVVLFFKKTLLIVVLIAIKKVNLLQRFSKCFVNLHTLKKFYSFNQSSKHDNNFEKKNHSNNRTKPNQLTIWNFVKFTTTYSKIILSLF